MKFRDWAQQIIYRIIDPVVHKLVKVGITPNIVTTTGLFFNIVSAVILIYGGIYGEKNDFSYIGWAGGVILFAGLFDMLDGQVARIGKMSSSFGALYDSVLDRYSELIVFLGICSYMMAQGYVVGFIIAFIALVGSLMVSYVRARAEGLGIECKVGFMQRPERVVLTAIGALGCGVSSFFIHEESVLNPIYIFEAALLIIAIFSNITAFTRLAHCRKVMNL
ncbi:CDP-alcohol phosphatidyltransferase family protein [Coprobacter fastidiosus]|jgi:CDP-diacylglycerol--glycerol-3-phosphate 3-phosphatidyltransferase|uniref:CDP-diacylglycerol--glycerol-3-phosphate 3-phosphatidyltransferase n=1 Tax=Coprobacter fastidiosus NSB1 = JCM 33896 TaxID=1349822 RepID=A0A495WL20_9BACT|nr:CDP-alcohol phosphatidyltransferase family protein [Coprobacter fastidiosus]EHL88168.1 hypothetical protein HMPREF1033_00677 [Tannerella sp. 6_1_58FAA_CT1]RHO53378.1 CDP-alcohol phosphatidyltransferase family protein [Tannerella sp. AM09-19]RHS47281.1 CDP-alcohol phosphatidyltransferase family protein [Tannerella sp. AF04-6]ERM88279.1 CDP-diacylglycerol-inositol 3-phosphatidyltransferase [Coprobacter fastidiosus NSB1 = JCM 33896]RKT61415.1 CDP-diacylglycerol--glycerol-3-phosphate 3-phosphat